MSEETEEDLFILCMRKDDTELSNVVEGSSLTDCFKCDHQVWISKASVQVMLEHDAKPLCGECAVKMPARGVNPPSAEQLKEILIAMKNILKNEDTTDRFKD
jgi:hypothetical protein